MSAAHRQRTCAACGGELAEDDPVSVEPLIDPSVRYVAVHWLCSTFVHPGGVEVGTLDTHGTAA